MARRGDGLYQRGKTWWLDFTHDGRRHVARLGRNINRTVAGELASVQRAAILKGEAGIGGPKRKDIALPERVPLKAVLDEEEIVTLAPEAKHLTDTIKMVAYRAETALVRCLAPHYAKSIADGRPA